MAGAWAVFWVAFTFFRHLHFQTQAWDMGIFDQLFWNTVHGNFMQGTLEEIPHHFGIHFSPTLLILVPFYALISSPYTLLFLQVSALAAGAFPLQAITRRRLPDPFPLIITAGYLLSPSLHWITTYDFHEIAFFIPLFLFAWNFLEAEKLALSAIFFALAAGTKEDAILAVLFAGIAIAMIHRKSSKKLRNFGIIVAGLALIYFILVVEIFMPSFGGGLLRMDRYSHLGSSAGEMIYNSLTNPLLITGTVLTAKKLSYIFWLLIPLAGATLFSGVGITLIIPGLAENLLTNFSAQFSGNYQYDAILLPGIFIGSIIGIKRILGYWPGQKNNLRAILIFTITAGYLLRSPVNPVFFPIEIFKSGPQSEAFSELIKNIPPDALVSANTNLVPHLSGRPEIYVLGSEPEPVDVVLADGADLFGFEDPEDFESYLSGYLDSGSYELNVRENRYIRMMRRDSDK